MSLKAGGPGRAYREKEEMVGRDGIEPPTPGFSVLNEDCLKPVLLNDFTSRGPVIDVAPSSGQLHHVTPVE